MMRLTQDREGAKDQVITEYKSGTNSYLHVECGTAASFSCLVHNIIMNERRAVQKFEGCGHGNHLAGFDTNAGGGHKGQ